MSSRVSLVIGINTYDHMPPLKSPAADAEAIAHRLEHDSDFKVLRLPEATARVGEEQQPQDIGKAHGKYPDTLPITAEVGGGQPNRGVWLVKVRKTR